MALEYVLVATQIQRQKMNCIYVKQNIYFYIDITNFYFEIIFLLYKKKKKGNYFIII